MSVDLTTFFQENNFKTDGKTNYGIYRQRAMAITTKSNYVKVSISLNEQILRDDAQKIMVKVAELRKEHRSLQKGIVTGISLELIFYQSSDLQSNIMFVINGAYDILDQAELRTKEFCPLCGKIIPEDAPFLKIKDGVVQAHNECIDKLLEATSQFEKGTFVDTPKTTLRAVLCNVITMIAMVALIIALSLSGLYSCVSIISGWVFTLIIKVVLQKNKIPFSIKYLIMLTSFAVLTCVLSVIFGGIFNVYMNGKEIMDQEVNLKQAFAMFPQYFTTYYDLVGYSLIFDFVLSILFVGFNTFFEFKKAKSTKNSIKKIV